MAKIILLILFLLSIFWGCSSTMPGGLTESSLPVKYGKYKILGHAEGSSKSIYILGIQSGIPDLNEATKNAIKSLNGDALINVRWYITSTNWIILPVTTVTTTVEGDVIKFVEDIK